MDREIAVTLALDGAAIAIAVFCGWRGARPPDPARGPRLVPWRMLMALSAAIAFVLSLHAVSLLRE